MLKTISPSIPQGAFGGGFKGSEIQKSGIITKRVDPLAPNLAHMCGFIWEWTYAKTINSSRPQGEVRQIKISRV